MSAPTEQNSPELSNAEQIHRTYWGAECDCPPGTVFTATATN